MAQIQFNMPLPNSSCQEQEEEGDADEEEGFASVWSMLRVWWEKEGEVQQQQQLPVQVGAGKMGNH